MKYFLVLAIILIAIISNFSQSTSQLPSSTKTGIDLLAEAKLTIEKGNLQWAEAWEKGQPEMVVELFAQDGKLLLSSGRVVKGHDQLLELYKNAMKGVGKEIKKNKSYGYNHKCLAGWRSCL